MSVDRASEKKMFGWFLSGNSSSLTEKLDTMAPALSSERENNRKQNDAEVNIPSVNDEKDIRIRSGSDQGTFDDTDTDDQFRSTFDQLIFAYLFSRVPIMIFSH